MHFGDSIFIFLLALVLIGPKKLPQIGRQVGNLLAAFHRARNEFKFQIQEEIRNSEDDQGRKELAESRAAAATPIASVKSAAQTEIPALAPDVPTIRPSIESRVRMEWPFPSPTEAAELLPVAPAPNSATLVADAAAAENHEARARTAIPATSYGTHSLTDDTRDQEPLTETHLGS